MLSFLPLSAGQPKPVSIRLFSILEMAGGVFLELGTKHGKNDATSTSGVRHGQLCNFKPVLIYSTLKRQGSPISPNLNCQEVLFATTPAEMTEEVG